VVEDAGVLINPMIVDGQIAGGVAQGIANALFEEMIYDENGNLLTASFADYLTPTSAEIPEIEITHMETVSPESVTKAKGCRRGRRDRRAGRGRQRHRRRAVAVRHRAVRIARDAAADS